MKNSIFLMLFVVVSIFSGCSSDGGGGVDFETVILTTKAPILDSNNLVIATGGNLSSDFSNSEDYEIGICYNTTPGPTVSNQVISQGTASQTVDFSAYINDINLSVTYYIRAYIRNSNTAEVKYGNEVSISSPALSTGAVKNISCSGFSIDITVPSGLSGNDARGICYSTSQNPTINNHVIPDATFGSGPFNISVQNSNFETFVNDNTTYYLKSYVRINQTYYYGNQVTFKTAGYIGGSGGYVFFDKGETSNGWRYLEAAPDHLTYNNDQNWLFQWNTCHSTTFLSGLSNDIGTGAENSSIIRNDCNFTNNAAAMAQYISVNGKSDWFLPSIEELKMLYNLKRENIISYTSIYPLASSSQQSNNTNFGVDFSNGNQETMLKTDGSRVWQVRRF